MTRSSTRPRLLFRICRQDIPFFQSCSQEDPSHDHQRVSITLERSSYYGFSSTIRGLICCQTDSRVLVGNPSTGQYVTLPRVRTRRRSIFTFFGYGPVDDVYKLLSMTVENAYRKRGSGMVSEEHQVYTLGAGQKAWRTIKCQHPHLPLPPFRIKEICMNGAVYYYAWVNNEGALISFNMRSEEFNVIKLPEDVRLVEEFCSLVNYSGKIALTRQSSNGTLDLRVLEDASEQEWSKVAVLVPSWRDLTGHYRFWFRGALSTGELIFTTPSFVNPFYFISYDLKENNAKRVVVEGTGDHSAHIEFFFDHVDSPMLLSNVK